MAVFNGKTYFKDNMLPFLTKIKAEITALNSVTGQYSGSGTTFAGLPTVDLQGGALGSGDWSALTVDDIGTGTVASPQYPAGTYATDGTTWALLQEHQDIADVIANIIATSAEVATGTAVDKVASLADLKAVYAQKTGEDTVKFEVEDGDIGTKESLNASQFTDVVTNAEAVADWDSIT